MVGADHHGGHVMLVPVVLILIAAHLATAPPAWRLSQRTPWLSRGRARDGPDVCGATCGPGAGGATCGPGARDGSLSVVTDVELFCACLEAGLTHEQAAHAVGVCGGDTAWLAVSAFLAVGVDPDTAWEPVRALPGCADIASLASASTRTGASIVAGCRRVADKLTQRAADERTAATERAGVLIALPLTTCFLPAFFLLGLVPVLVSLGAQFF